MSNDTIFLGNINLGQNRTKVQKSPKRKKIESNDDEFDSKFNDNHKRIKISGNSSEKSLPSLPSFDHQHRRLFDENFRENIPEIPRILKSEKHERLFSETDFSKLNLNPMLVACLQQRFNLTKATTIQAISIPLLMQGSDALIKSCTGSGKTLAYALPLINHLQSIEPKINRTDGLLALIITPTRELAIQTYDCLDRLLNPFRRIVIGLMIGGEKKKSEKARIRKGLNILVTTPGRLLDHINRTRNLQLNKLKWLVIDEADRLYEQGFSAIISQIIECIRNALNNVTETNNNESKKSIQTVLLSATLSEGVKELAGLSLKNPKLIDVGGEEDNNSNQLLPGSKNLDTITLPSSLQNNYMIVPAKLRLITLSCLILDSLQKNALSSKIIVFTSCQDVVDFYYKLFQKIFQQKQFFEFEFNIKLFKLHGQMSQTNRTEVFKEFHRSKQGILICTDVASRGLDLPNVDLIIQMSAPSMIEDFVHRAGRTARLGKPGQSILILLPSEIKFIEFLQEQLSINFQSLLMEDYFKCSKLLKFSNEHNNANNLNTDQERLAYLQQIYEKFISKNFDDLHQLASKAYLSYLRSYATYPKELSKNYLPFRMLHFGHLAKSFALQETPKEFIKKFNRNFININKNNNKTTDICGSLKRTIKPLEERITEFGGGISTDLNIGKKKKKIKKNNNNN